MSKQPPRQTSKQGQTTNKQSNNLSSKQTVPANKQTANVPLKQGRPDNKQTANASVKQGRSANRPLTRQAIKQERREEEKRRRLGEQQRARRNKRIFVVSLIAIVVLVASAISVYAFQKARNSTAQNPNALPTEQVFNSAYQPVDGIYCDQLEQTAYHIHVHLTIYINGQPIAVPQGVGIATDQSCLYWLHTHTGDGVIHIEAPQTAALTLENFLDIWGKEFSQLGYHNELAESAGWTIYVDGKQVQGDFKSVVFTPHKVITIMYNSPNAKPDTIYNFPQGL
jgi:hypothetical protein